MTDAPLDPKLSDRDRSDLAAYADGSLSARRRAALDERLASDPALRARLDEQRAGLSAIRAADVRAPLSLRERLEDQRRRAAPAARRRRIIVGGGLAGAAGAVALTLALVLPGDVPGGPSLVQAARLSTLAPTGPPPTPKPGNPGLLNISSGSVTFPDWKDIEWPASGMRTDQLGDRSITTVFYVREGRTVGYSIVAGRRLRVPAATTDEVVGDTRYHLFQAGRLRVVTWVRDGQTCVLTGRTTKPEILFKLAAYRGPHAAPGPAERG